MSISLLHLKQLLPIAHCPLPTAHCRLPTTNCPLRTSSTYDIGFNLTLNTVMLFGSRS